MTPVHPEAGLAATAASTERTQCVPLMEAASADLYKRNGFRITGLAVDATAKQVSKRGEELKLMESLGRGAGANTNAFPLNPPPSVDDIREALQRLKDPEARIIDEFFWFWPEGPSQGDEAIQAYLKGDGERAFDLWHSRRGTSAQGMIAYHNLAVINHMMAIEWTTQYLDSPPEDAVHETTRAYWSTAIRYWRKIVDDDEAWDALKERIRVLDDPRLTTGLPRRIRGALPEAVASINAAFALKLAERGQMSATEVHIKYVRDIGLDFQIQEELFAHLLQPTRTRFASLVAEVSNKNLPATKRFAAVQSVLDQISGVSHLLEIFFGKMSHHRTEVLDEAVVACAVAGTIYRNETEDSAGFLEAAKKSILYATSKEARERVQNNIDYGEKQARIKAFEPFIKELEKIVSSSDSPAVKLASIKREIMPWLATIIREAGPHSEEAHDLQDQVAISLRSIGIDAHNDHEDLDTALETTKLASKLARDVEVRAKLAEDQKQLNNNAEGQAKRRVDIVLKPDLLLGSGDRIQMDRQSVTYKNIHIPVSDINAVRYGIFREFRGPIIVKGVFRIGIHSSRGTVISIECKRPLASYEQAQKDYEAIVNGLFNNVIPGLAMRIAQSILSGGFRLGQSTMTADGMTLPSNRLFGHDEVFVPYSQIRYGFSNGVLNIVKSGEERIRRSFTVREVWNAPIFEQILKAIPLVQSKK